MKLAAVVVSSLLLTVVDIERARVVAAADRFLEAPPQTITAFPAARSAGGLHDFFSEGDY